MDQAEVSSHSLARQMNRQLVMEVIVREGPISRVDVAEATGLSKPTVSSIVAELVDEGWIADAGVRTGSVGRAATLFVLDGRSGYAIGVDLGGTKTRAAIADLNGELLAELVEPTDPAGGVAVVEQIAALCRRLADEAGADGLSRVRAVAVGSPGVLDPVTGGMDLAFNIPTFGDVHLRDELTARLGLPVIVENDVNMAAIGEQWRGLAAGRRDFAFVAVGTGLGMGIVVDGELRRGHRGAAGEIAYLPIGADPFDPDNQRKGPLEEAVAGAAIVRRYGEQAAQDGAPALETVPDVFAAAERGEQPATKVVEQVARDLALGIVAVVAVLDSELIVLGGGIGSTPLFARHVEVALASATSLVPEVAVSALGHRASLVGAVAVGLRAAHEGLFAADGQPGAWSLPSTTGRAHP